MDGLTHSVEITIIGNYPHGTEEEMTFAEFVERWTGRDMAYHERAETTGLIFAEACWNAALECAAAKAQDTAAGCDAEAIADAILRMRSNVEGNGLAEREHLGFTPEMVEVIYAAWHGAGVDISGGDWRRFVGMLPMRSNVK